MLLHGLPARVPNSMEPCDGPVNCFKPSMKLQSKQQEGRHVPTSTIQPKLHPTSPALRPPACPDAAGTARVPRALNLIRLFQQGEQLLSFYHIPPFYPSLRLFRRTLYDGSASRRGKRSRSGSRVLPLNMVDKSTSPSERMSGWVSLHSAVQGGRFILLLATRICSQLH